MIVHIALFRWRSDVSESQIDKVMVNIKNLKSQIKDVIEIMCGKNFSKYSDGFTHAVVVTFKDRKGLDAYRAHPAHRPIAKMVDSMEEKSIGIDFES